MVEAALFNVNGGKVDPNDPEAQKSAISPERQYSGQERLAAWAPWALPEGMLEAFLPKAPASRSAAPPKHVLDPEVARSLLLAQDAGLLTGPVWSSVPVDRRGWPLCRVWADVEAAVAR